MEKDVWQSCILFLFLNVLLKRNMKAFKILVLVLVVGSAHAQSKSYQTLKENFINHINIISGLNTTIKIKSPFINLSKKEVVLLGKSLGVNYDTCPINTNKNEITKK